MTSTTFTWGGVDKSDQYLSYYGFDHRMVKWYKRAVFHPLDLAIVNAYIMYKLSVQSGKHMKSCTVSNKIGN